MYNARIASKPNNDLINSGTLGSQVYSTPTKNFKNNDTIRAINNGSPTPSRGLYRSGRENAMSSSTTGTSILGFGREGFGRENSGGPTILERRRARQENRDSSLIHGGSPRTPWSTIHTSQPTKADWTTILRENVQEWPVEVGDIQWESSWNCVLITPHGLKHHDIRTNHGNFLLSHPKVHHAFIISDQPRELCPFTSHGSCFYIS